MGWRDLLQKTEHVTAPWVGGRKLQIGVRTWTIEGRLPREYGWYRFEITGQKAKALEASDPAPEVLIEPARGYLVGDRLIREGARVEPTAAAIIATSEPVLLLDPGLDRFVRISAGRLYEGGPLIFKGQEMPLGPEESVLSEFLDEATSVAHVKEVPPALDAAFRMESWRRIEAARQRAELERIRREEEARRQAEERRQQLFQQLGDAAGRRQMAAVDFAEAARAALAVGGAVYLDHRASTRRGEMAVRFRFNGRRFECVCDQNTLRIIESGICLTAHYDDDDFEGGTRGDTFFTLESLPAVIAQAIGEGKLVVFRHVN